MKVTGLRSQNPVWTPDGRRIVFGGGASDRNHDVYIRNADGSGVDELLIRTPGRDSPTDVSRDGKWLLFTTGIGTSRDLMIAPLVRNAVPRPIVAGPAREMFGVFSPDTKFIAYASDESGQWEVYAQPLSGGERVQISAQGGTEPRWSADGSELFFIDGNGQLAVSAVTRGDRGPRFSPSRVLFDIGAPASPAYDVSPDGSRFVVTDFGRRFKRLFYLTNALPRD